MELGGHKVVQSEAPTREFSLQIGAQRVSWPPSYDVTLVEDGFDLEAGVSAREEVGRFLLPQGEESAVREFDKLVSEADSKFEWSTLRAFSSGSPFPLPDVAGKFAMVIFGEFHIIEFWGTERVYVFSTKRGRTIVFCSSMATWSRVRYAKCAF